MAKCPGCTTQKLKVRTHTSEKWSYAYCTFCGDTFYKNIVDTEWLEWAKLQGSKASAKMLRKWIKELVPLKGPLV